MIFIETPIFTEDIRKLMPDETYAELQQHLTKHPNAGNIIQGTGGIRKVRWSLPGQGKRGGVRIIYFWLTTEGQILMLLVYKKAKQENLTSYQKRNLRQILENW